MQTQLLAQALTLHQQGQIDLAAQLYARILAGEPNNPDALHLLGLACLQRGDLPRAVEFISRAIAVLPSVAIFHANLGEAYRQTRQLDLAAGCCATAVQLKPDYPEAHNTLGLIEMDRGQLAESVKHFEEALRLRPNFALAHNNLGNAYRHLNNATAALAHFRRAVEADPNLAMAHGNLGQMLLARKELAEALEHSQLAVRMQPASMAAHNNLGNVLRQMGRLAEAKAAYLQALRLSPHLAMIHHNIAQVLEEEGGFDEALRWYQQAINLEPNNALFHLNLANLWLVRGDAEQALACVRRALQLDSANAAAHVALGQIEHERGRTDEARRLYEEAVRLNPELSSARLNLAQVLQELNDPAGAERQLRETLRFDPREPRAHAQLATLVRGGLPEADLRAAQKLAADPLLAEGLRAGVLFGLAQVHDARGDYGRAAECLRLANPLEATWLAKRGASYDPDVHSRFIDRLLAAFSPELFDRLAGAGSDSERPVFIVGLPRSGTTLLEQILASHPQVHALGETRLARETFLALAPGGNEGACFEALARLDGDGARRLAARHLDALRARHADADRVVDKMPDNYMYLGLLSVLFPQARFIHCRRDLRDVAVSVWMTHFRSLRWAYDAGHIVRRFADYRRVMEHWAQVLPAGVLDVDYEETVEDLEGVARRMVDWCGLEWDPACLEFHRTRRPVRTASVLQVRQPLYTRSVGRWKHYDPALGALFRRLESLGELDLVEAHS